MAPGIKKVNFNATFGTNKHIFSCEREKIAKEIESHFNIKMRDVTLYKVDKDSKQRSRIEPEAIADLSHIEIISNQNGQRTIQAGENEAPKKMVDGIVSKLRQNTPLNGKERQALIEALETHSTSIFKRKLCQTDINESSLLTKPAVHNKKLQVVMPGKESFTQTDFINISLNDKKKPVNNEETAKDRLKRMWKADDKPSEEIDLLMKDTYDERRKLILGNAPVKLVKEQYPHLFCVEQVRNELDRIFYPGKCKEFLKNMKKYAQHILYYKEDGDKVKEIVDIIAKACDRAKTAVQKSYAEVVGSVFLLAKLLDEDFGFIHLNDYPLSEKEDAYPHIDGSAYTLKEIHSNEISYCVILEGEHLCKTSNFPEAILCLVASFFIFNIVYPENCYQTLIAFEKLYLEAQETTDVDEWTSNLIDFYKKEADDTKTKILK